MLPRGLPADQSPGIDLGDSKLDNLLLKKNS